VKQKHFKLRIFGPEMYDSIARTVVPKTASPKFWKRNSAALISIKFAFVMLTWEKFFVLIYVTYLFAQ